MTDQTAQMFARLTKVDEAKRQVTGVIASEHPDNANEVFDYETSKPHFEKWSQDMAKASGGKHVGNVRAMHSNIAAGGLSEIIFDDMAKTITVTADIVDDGEWNKVQKGIYTGFSIGGKYLKKWTDALNKALKRYTGVPSEVSLVDAPCNGFCSFTLVKADGAESEVNFDETEHGLLSKISDTETSMEDKLEAMHKLNAMMGIQTTAVVGGEEEELVKGAYTIERLASLADSVESLLNYSKWTVNGDSVEGGGIATIPDELKKAAGILYDALLKCVSGDVAAAKERLKGVKKVIDDGDLAKLDAADTMQKLRTDLGLDDQGSLCVLVDETMGKFVSTEAGVEELKKYIDAHNALVVKAKEDEEELVKLRAEPVAAKGSVKAVPVGKAEDGKLAKAGEATVEEVEEKDPLKLIKLAQSQPMTVAPSGNLAKIGQ